MEERRENIISIMCISEWKTEGSKREEREREGGRKREGEGGRRRERVGEREGEGGRGRERESGGRERERG